MPIRAKNSGFTLVEISIVLVIIGLIIGGVLVGQDMIRAATIRAEISDIVKIKTAINAFKGKYNCLPGDCVSASEFDLGVNGNGNGVIDQIYAAEPEAPNAWVHLSRAGMIEGSYSGNLSPGWGIYCTAENCPKSKLVPNNTMVMSSIKNFISDQYGSPLYNTGYYRANNTAIIWFESVSNYKASMAVADVYAMDAKMDDGMAATGKFITVNDQFSTPPLANCITADPMVTDGSARYNLTHTVPECQPFFLLE